MAAAPGPSVETKVDHSIAAEVSANMDSPELEDWFDAKHRFQVAAYRLLVQTMHKVHLHNYTLPLICVHLFRQPEADPAAGVTDAALYAEHAGASIAIVAATLRLLTNDDGSLKVGLSIKFSGIVKLRSCLLTDIRVYSPQVPCHRPATGACSLSYLAHE